MKLKIGDPTSVSMFYTIVVVLRRSDIIGIDDVD